MSVRAWWKHVTERFRATFRSAGRANSADALGRRLRRKFILVAMGAVIRPMVESYSKQKRFITDASHEIKTPLAVIDAANEVQEIESGESEWTQSIHCLLYTSDAADD